MRKEEKYVLAFLVCATATGAVAGYVWCPEIDYDMPPNLADRVAFGFMAGAMIFLVVGMALVAIVTVWDNRQRRQRLRAAAPQPPVQPVRTARIKNPYYGQCEVCGCIDVQRLHLLGIPLHEDCKEWLSLG